MASAGSWGRTAIALPPMEITMKTHILKTLALVTATASATLGSAKAPTQAPASEGAPTTLRALYGLKAPTRLQAPHTALLLVDFQEEFFQGRLPLPEGKRAVASAAALASFARASGIVVVHVRNLVTHPGSLLFAAGSATTEIVTQLKPHPEDLELDKSMAGAFSRTDLDARLRARGIDTLIVGGLMTHLAVNTTASDGTVLGYHVIVAADATATRDLPGAAGYPGVDASTLQRVALAAMADRVADVMLTEAIMKLPVER